MTADSEPGQGSTFTFTMRFDLPTEDDKPAVMPEGNEKENEKVMAQDPSKDMGWPSQVTVVPERAQATTEQVEISMSQTSMRGLVARQKNLLCYHLPEVRDLLRS